jgi:hypothetical protein
MKMSIRAEVELGVIAFELTIEVERGVLKY